MARSSLAALTVLAAVLATASCSCYNYYTAGTCNGLCPGGKCYWVFRPYKKRSAENVPALEDENQDEEAEAEAEEDPNALDRNKRVDDPDFPPQGYCDCCTLKCIPPKVLSPRCRCICPYTPCSGGQVLNQQTCKCECPAHTYWDSSLGNCVGDCKWLSTSVCSKIRCNINKHLYCIQYGSSCRCPTCSDYYYQHTQCLSLKCADTGYPCKWKYHPYYPYYYYCSCY